MSDVTKVKSLREMQEALANYRNLVVVFSAMDWCVNCKRLAPHVEAAANTLKDYTFLEVDVDHVEGIKEHFSIMSVPQVWLYEGDGVDGREIKGRTALPIISEIRR